MNARTEIALHIAAHKKAVADAEASIRAELEELIYDHVHHGARLFPATLSCGCRVTLRHNDDEGDTWTQRDWTLCPRHLELDCEP